MIEQYGTAKFEITQNMLCCFPMNTPGIVSKACKRHGSEGNIRASLQQKPRQSTHQFSVGLSGHLKITAAKPSSSSVYMVIVNSSVLTSNQLTDSFYVDSGVPAHLISLKDVLRHYV